MYSKNSGVMVGIYISSLLCIDSGESCGAGTGLRVSMLAGFHDVRDWLYWCRALIGLIFGQGISRLVANYVDASNEYTVKHKEASWKMISSFKIESPRWKNR